MASIKLKFRPSESSTHEGTLFYRIIHERMSRQLTSSYRILPSEWNDRLSKVIIPASGQRRAYLLAVSADIRADLERLSAIVRKLDSSGIAFTADDIIEEFKTYKADYSLFNYMEKLICGLKQQDRIRTSETYRAALNSFRNFLNGADIMIDRIDSPLMQDYEAWLKSRGITTNTISFYNRILRAVYNRATDNDLIANRRPFRHVYTGIDKTVKRALPLGIVREIRQLDLSFSKSLDFARDMFIMSFMLRGMSFVDMAFLRKSDLSNGRIKYRRRKTGKTLTIEWTSDMQAIVNKYPCNNTAYLLPIITRTGFNERCIYRNAASNINYNLKLVAALVGIRTPLTLYVARHSWATAARTKGVPVSVISEGMGHCSESITRIYLASMDVSVVDKANSMILASL